MRVLPICEPVLIEGVAAVLACWADPTLHPTWLDQMRGWVAHKALYSLKCTTTNHCFKRLPVNGTTIDFLLAKREPIPVASEGSLPMYTPLAFSTHTREPEPPGIVGATANAVGYLPEEQCRKGSCLPEKQCPQL